MSLYRTLIVFNSLFSEYMFNDFEYKFLDDFIYKATAYLN